MNETTSTPGALVLQTTSPYRTIAQKHWGLTNEQMKGMHVHHRVPQSLGGTNDPSNLYVCSPWFHANVWHDNSYFIEQAAIAGSLNTPSQMEGRARGGGHPANQRTKDAVRQTGLNNRGKKYPRNGSSQNGAPITNSQKWECLVTGKITSPGPLSQWQRHRGIDVALRKRVS